MVIMYLTATWVRLTPPILFSWNPVSVQLLHCVVTPQPARVRRNADSNWGDSFSGQTPHGYGKGQSRERVWNVSCFSLV